MLRRHHGDFISRRLDRLAAALLGLSSLAPAAFAGDPDKVYRPERYHQAARGALTMALERQAGEGRVRTHTLWNYHFYADSAELHPAGRSQLDRLARQVPSGCLDLYVETARDVDLNSEDNRPQTILNMDEFERYFARRDELNAERIQAVSLYLQRAGKGQPLGIHIHEHPQVGMQSDEALRAHVLLRVTASGILPPRITESTFFFSGADGGGGGGGSDPIIPYDSALPALLSTPTGGSGGGNFSSDTPGGPGDFSN